MEKITLCGDDCLQCPRYTAKSDAELEAAAELWYRVGWRDSVVSPEEMRCDGCSPDKHCTYQLTDCVKANRVDKCSQCPQFPCEKIDAMLRRLAADREKCRELCSDGEFRRLEAAFFRKEENLRK